MTESGTCKPEQRSRSPSESRQIIDPQFQAYLIARETMRRLMPSPSPCFARDWRPKPGRIPAQQ